VRGTTLEIKYQVDDSLTTNMTEGALERLVKQSEAHTLEIIKEAERVEESLREHGAKIEITENTIFQAVRRNNTQFYKKNWKDILTRICAEVFLLLSGILFDYNKISNNIIYFIVYFVIITIAIVLTTITYIKDGK